MPRTLLISLVLMLPGCRPADPVVEGILVSETTAGPLRVRSAWGLQPFTNAPLPGYLRIVNTGTRADTLLGASSAVATHAMLHGTGSGGAMAMLDRVVVGPGDSVVMAPGGLHLMFEGLQRRIVAGDTVTMVLRFAHAGEVAVPLPVVGYDKLDLLAAPR